jgi:hypothetical protein
MPNRVLNGEFPSGLIDWGSDTWFLSGPWGRFSTNNISFVSGITRASFTFLTPRHLAQLGAFNGGATDTTLTISCPGQTTLQVALRAGELTTLQTGWTRDCGSVTLDSTNGWDTNFDNLVVQ